MAAPRSRSTLDALRAARRKHAKHERRATHGEGRRGARSRKGASSGDESIATM